MITESELEAQAITWFHDTGWEFRHGPYIAPDGDTPERVDYRQVLLTARLLDALRRLNPEIPEIVLEDTLRRIAKPDHPSLVFNNRSFHEALLNGVPVETESSGEKRGDRVRLVDFERPERNRFLIVNQFLIQGINQLQRPDLFVFVNGLPIALIELKNLVSEQTDIWSAFNQLQTLQGGDFRSIRL